MNKKYDPSLGPGERSLFVNFRVPESVFETPEFRANIIVDDETSNRVQTIDIPVGSENEINFWVSEIAKLAERDDDADAI